VATNESKHSVRTVVLLFILPLSVMIPNNME